MAALITSLPTLYATGSIKIPSFLHKKTVVAAPIPPAASVPPPIRLANGNAAPETVPAGTLLTFDAGPFASKSVFWEVLPATTKATTADKYLTICANDVGGVLIIRHIAINDRIFTDYARFMIHQP